jgi:hypothetical protein
MVGISSLLSGFQTIPEDGIIWFHCHTTRKRVHEESAGGLCVSRAIGLSAMKRARIRVFLDKNLETFLRDAAFTTFLLSLRRFASLMTRKLAPHAQALATRHSVSLFFFFLGVNFVLKVAMNHRKI